MAASDEPENVSKQSTSLFTPEVTSTAAVASSHSPATESATLPCPTSDQADGTSISPSSSFSSGFNPGRSRSSSEPTALPSFGSSSASLHANETSLSQEVLSQSLTEPSPIGPQSTADVNDNQGAPVNGNTNAGSCDNAAADDDDTAQCSSLNSIQALTDHFIITLDQVYHHHGNGLYVEMLADNDSDIDGDKEEDAREEEQSSQIATAVTSSSPSSTEQAATSTAVAADAVADNDDDDDANDDEPMDVDYQPSLQNQDRIQPRPNQAEVDQIADVQTISRLVRAVELLLAAFTNPNRPLIITPESFYKALCALVDQINYIIGRITQNYQQLSQATLELNRSIQAANGGIEQQWSTMGEFIFALQNRLVLINRQSAITEWNRLIRLLSCRVEALMDQLEAQRLLVERHIIGHGNSCCGSAKLMEWPVVRRPSPQNPSAAESSSENGPLAADEQASADNEKTDNDDADKDDDGEDDDNEDKDGNSSDAE